MAISTWEPSELDKQTQTAQQALARISELETEAADLDELYRVLNLACNDHITRWMKAEAALTEQKKFYEDGIRELNALIDSKITSLAERDREHMLYK